VSCHENVKTLSRLISSESKQTLVHRLWYTDSRTLHTHLLQQRFDLSDLGIGGGGFVEEHLFDLLRRVNLAIEPLDVVLQRLCPLNPCVFIPVLASLEWGGEKESTPESRARARKCSPVLAR